MSDIVRSSPVSRGLTISVGTKVFAVVGLCLALLLAVAGVSIWQMSRIGHEIEAIAERDLPLTGILSKVTIHQMEQSIALERALRSAGIREDADTARRSFEEAFKAFSETAEQVETEIGEAERIAHAAYEAAPSEDARKVFLRIEEMLKAIHAQHRSFDKHSLDAFAHARSGNTAAAIELLPVVQKEEDQLNRAMTEMFLTIEGFTEDAARVAEEHEKFALKVLVALSLAAVLLGLVLSWWLVRHFISRPLSEIVAGLNALSGDDMSVDVPVRSDDEIGAVATAYATFKATLSRTKELEAEQQEQERRAAEERKTLMQELANRFDASVGEIVASVASTGTELSSAAETLTRMSEDNSVRSSNVASASEQASTNLNSVAAAAQEMSQTVGDISRQLSDTSTLSTRAVENVSSTSSRIEELAEIAGRIGEVVSMISDIAEQTNLLALNATIESARAGEAGKGFAVVAHEVKALANQTTRATEEISRQIRDVQAATRNSVDSIGEIRAIVSQLNEAAVAISAAVEEQEATTQEIARNVQEAASGTSDVTRNISEVNKAAQNTEHAVGEVHTSSTDLSRQAETLKVELDDFLAGIRAG